MKKSFFLTRLSTVLAACMLSFATISAGTTPKPFVIPELKSWTGAEGNTALSGRIIVKSPALKTTAQALAADYEEIFGKKLTITKGGAKTGDIVLALKKHDGMGSEGYRLAIGKTVEITAATAQGAFWGTRTLLQLSEQQKERVLPCGTALDEPQYGLRGFMIDCGRKYIPITYLRNLVKIMAYYKMNTLQVHLNDNAFKQYFNNDWFKTQAAFRLESSYFPGLTAKDGHYTKQEFIDFQKLAESNHVEVIPEIDVPAHSLAFTQYRPSLGSKEYGMDHLDLFNPEVYTFLDSLFAEYIGGKDPVFRGPRMHIGTDEYSNAKKEVVEKFRAFTDHYIRYVEKFGKQAMLWGALTHANGSTPVKSENVIMNCWYNGYANPQEMKKQGYKLVSIPDGLVYIVPAAGYYYDYLNCRYLYDNWTPANIGNQTFADNDPAVMGGMFAVWNDHAGNGISTKDIHHRAYPAIQTLAVKCWTGKATTFTFDDFDARRQLLSEAPGVNELGRIGSKGSTIVELSEVNPGTKLPVEEIGYNYAVTFTVEGETEDKGNILFSSENATFYLSDPKEGKLGFARDGYLNTFNYRIEKGAPRTLCIEGDNHSTRLLVDGKLREELGSIPLYTMNEYSRAHFQTNTDVAAEPVVYNPKERINYQRTLVFPLRNAGNFKSRVTGLKVEVK